MPQQRKHKSNSARQAAYRTRQAIARKKQLAERGLPSLPTLASLPGNARWNAAIRRSVDMLTLVRDEMADYFDERSEAWQEGDRGVIHQERGETLDEWLSALDDLVS